MENQSNFYNQTTDETATSLNTSLQNGLPAQEAATRLNQYGYNEFQKKEGKTLFDKYIAQFKRFMIIVLLVAAVVSGVVGFIHGEGITDAIIILGIVVLNAVIGVVQEAKAEQSLAALEKMTAPNCKVIRDGQVSVIASRELVPGDLVVLDTGDLIPADLRLTEAVNLKIQEASLTGESVPEDKFTDVINEAEVPLGDRENLAFSSCLVTYGRGKGVVVGTGMTTEVGKIAAMIQSVPESMTPLQMKLDKLGKFLGIGALAICVLLFITGIAYGKSVLDMFMTAVSLAAAAIPEGLPAVSTIVLAVGVQRLVKKNAIIKTLPSVETLGSTTVICSDKTGTLTQNRMTVVKIYSDGVVLDADNAIQSKSNSVLKLVDIAVLANDAKLSGEMGEYSTTGDPTETALIDLGLKFDANKNQMDEAFVRLAEIPFDSERKLMTTVQQTGNGYEVCTKGGVDELLSVCTSILKNDQVQALTQVDKDAIEQVNADLAKQALRVLVKSFKKHWKWML